MTLLGKETFLFVLGLSASVSGRRDDMCLARGNSKNKGLPEDVSVDCDNVPPSLDNITMFLTGSDSFNGNVFSSSDAYDAAALQYASARVVTKPSYIIEAMNEVDVQATIMFAAHCELKVTARSGGHSFVGSSSCDGDETACIQLDVGNIAHLSVSEDGGGVKQVNLGPGARLENLYPELIANEIYIPGGECSDIGIGGHMQTGGIGPWMRSFGYFSHYVESFKIVLADGSLMSVTAPQEKVKSKLNDDLWYAVIGGASGSFGTLVDITLNTVDEDDYFAFYWEVNFFYDDSTVECIKNMLREFVIMLEDEDFKNDPRWTIWFTITGLKTLLSAGLGPLGLAGFNYFQLDFTWVVPKDSGQEKDDVFAEAEAIYGRLLAAFQRDDDNCITLDQYFEDLTVPDATKAFLKGRFLSTYATADEDRTLSQLHNDVTLFDWDALGIEDQGFPFKSSYQQGPQFPNEDDLIEIFDHIDASVPKAGEPAIVISQIVTLPGPLKSKRAIALPFQDDVMGVSFDMWNLFPPVQVDFGPTLREVQDLVISAFGEEDHRMFWGAYEDTCLECGAWEKYYESRPKYNELTVGSNAALIPTTSSSIACRCQSIL